MAETEVLTQLSVLVGVLFFLALGVLVVWNGAKLFVNRRHGRNHASTGLAYLAVIAVSFLDASGIAYLPSANRLGHLALDSVLGAVGIVLTLTAASDFKHVGVKNIASGTLDAHATVTHGEMIEHAFYQGLNLVQVLFLHAVAFASSSLGRAWGDGWVPLVVASLLLALATLPWAVRHRFPINRFSDNYNKIDPKSSSLVRVLYRVKKYQYVFYKGFLLHGLNIAQALSLASLSPSPPPLVRSSAFRLYWALLNTAYTMEFFLQTLVKKGYLAQRAMLALNALLMLASTGAALGVLAAVYPSWLALLPAPLSVVLNFASRGQDVRNTGLIFAALLLLLHGTASYNQHHHQN